MKFLLVAINAKYIHSNPALYSLKAYAGAECADEIEIAEYTVNNRMEEILAGVYKKKPDAAAFSCYIWNRRMVLELTEELHKVLPDIPIWLGGPEVSFDAEEILEKHSEVAGIMIGEGEKTFRELFGYYKRNGLGKALESNQDTADMSGIGGIVYRRGSRIIRTREREPVNISDIPFLYENPEKFRNRIIYYESSRGCPFRCSYCLSAIDKRVRFRDMETVKKELQFLLDAGVAQVKFVDRTFNCSHGHTMEVWKYIQQHDNGVTNFHFEIAADKLDEEEIEVLSQMRPGLVQLEIGVQSANLDTLREIDRTADMEKLKMAVSRIRGNRNVHMHLDLIAGLPYEGYESFGKSFDEVYAMEPDQLQLGFLKVLKGSPMQERAGKYGIKYTSGPPYEVLCTDWLSFEEICRLKRIEEMVEIYYNSNQFTHTLPVLEKAFTSPFAMFEKLADYYEENGYFINSPSRLYRYQVLLDFALCYGNKSREKFREEFPEKEYEDLYKELLTYDIYLRENMKSRPDFARDLSPYKDTFRDFYNDAARLKEVLPGYGEYQPKQIARMTHMEIFSYPVWERGGNMDRLQEEKRILFDYGRRNPLTNEAAAVLV